MASIAEIKKIKKQQALLVQQLNLQVDEPILRRSPKKRAKICATLPTYYTQQVEDRSSTAFFPATSRVDDDGEDVKVEEPDTEFILVRSRSSSEDFP